jgi:hypothetical protein
VEGFPEVTVLTDVEPALVQSATDGLEPTTTLVVVEHKSGDSIELQSLEAHFWQKMKQALGLSAGQHFVAVTDPRSELSRLATRRNYAHIFENPPDMSGTFSAISFLGLVPAALLGVKLDVFAEDAKRMAEACSPAVSIDQNPGLRLGAFIAGLAYVGRDKLTLLFEPEVSPFGHWVEQLLCEASGRGKGVVPVVGERLESSDIYGPDRCFVYTRLAGQRRTALDDGIDALVAAGQPVARITLREKAELGGEFFRWEVATALVASFLRISPFEDKSVVSSRAATRRFIDAFLERRSMPKWRSLPPTADPIIQLVRKTKSRDYIALGAFFTATEERDRLFAEIRQTLLKKLGVATTHGYGTRFLHATSRLRRFGPNNVVELVLTAQSELDVPIPESDISFATLRDAQALGDLQLMQHFGRRALRIHLEKDIDAGLAALLDKLREL